jgi:hypothetical protein
MMVDLQRIRANKYQAAGTLYSLRGGLKAKQPLPWGDLTLFVSQSHAAVWGYNNLSFDMINKIGWKANSFYPDYARAYHAALPQNAESRCGACTCAETSALIPYDTSQTTNDAIYSLAHHFRSGSNLAGGVQVYAALSATSASLADPTAPSPSSSPFSEQVQRPHHRRLGVTVDASYTVGDHVITTGAWREQTRALARTSWYNEPALGNGASLKTTGPYGTYGPSFQSANDSYWRIRSSQFHLHDDYAITDDITLGAGFKKIDFITTGGGTGADETPYGSLRVKNVFLPHISVPVES